MARVPEAELARLKREVSVARLAKARGVKLQRRGQELLGLCPFHDDKEPSLVINQAKNLWHCLGSCGEGGSVIDWVMKAEGVSFRHAVELLRADLPAMSSGAGTDSEPVRQSTVQKLPSPLDFDAEDQELLLQVVDYYHETLKSSRKAMKYLGSRGIAHPEAIERFRLGFANRTLGYRLPAKNRKAGGEIRGRLTELGIYRDSGHEHFNGCLVIPVFDEAGRVAEIYGRKVTKSLKKGVPLHLYLPGPHRGVWNAQALQESKEVNPHRVADRRSDLLVGRLPQRDRGLRHVRLHRGAPGGLPAPPGRAGAPRLRPGRRRRDGGQEGGRALGARRRRLLPGPLPPRHGRQRVRAQGRAGEEEPGAGAPQRRLPGRGAGAQPIAGPIAGALAGSGAGHGRDGAVAGLRAGPEGS